MPDVDPVLAVWESLPPPREHLPEVVIEQPGAGVWPGVADPDLLRAQLVHWLTQYSNANTRSTYAYALGLPIAWVDTLGSAASTTTASPDRHLPPPARRGPLYDLKWLRWCARHELDPRVATGCDVIAWVHALEIAGASRRTRDRMLATIAAFYGHLTTIGVIPGNPAGVSRRHLGLSGLTAGEVSPAVELTAGEVRALLVAARGLPPSAIRRYRQLYVSRAVAFIALLTLGLRISELTGLDRSDRYTSGGRGVLRVLGRGNSHRTVDVTDFVAAALDEYLTERDRIAGTAADRRPRADAPTDPLIATAAGGRCSRIYLCELLGKIAKQARPELGKELAGRVHPHAFRHFYITTALEQGASIQQVQADAGHATITSTGHYSDGGRTFATSAADLVAVAIAAADSSGRSG